MEPLIVHYKNKVLTIPIESLKQGFGLDEYRLTGKDGELFLFRKDGNKWSHTFGKLPQLLIEAILDALILRFNYGIVKVFWYKGERQIVEVYHPKGGGGWVVKINYIYKAGITYNPDDDRYAWYIHNECWLKERHMLHFIEMIKLGEIESPEGYSIKKAP